MAFDQLPLALQVLAAALLVIGGLFTLVGAIGLVRFPDFYIPRGTGQGLFYES